MKLSFLGDVMFTHHQLECYKEKEKYNFIPAVESIFTELKTSDYIVANLETPIAGEELGYTSEPYSFNSPIEVANALKVVGVNMVQTANNHCLDRGITGLNNTIHNLDKIGLAHIGTHIDKESPYKVIDINGIKVGFLCFTYGTNAFFNHNYLRWDQRHKVDLLQRQEQTGKLRKYIDSSMFMPIRIVRYILKQIKPEFFDGPIYERREIDYLEKRNLKRAIKECKNAGADYIIVCLHIGGQYNNAPTKYTKKICEYCRTHGANVVMANHEHVIHPFDKENISDMYFCAYSLGNFISSTGIQEEPYDKYANYSVVYDIDIEKIKGKVVANYNFRIFCSHEDEKGKIITESLWRYFCNCSDNKIKKKLIMDNNVLMNRIFQTRNKEYLIEKEYSILI